MLEECNLRRIAGKCNIDEVSACYKYLNHTTQHFKLDSWLKF